VANLLQLPLSLFENWSGLPKAYSETSEHLSEHGVVKRRESSILAARTATPKIRRAQVHLATNMAVFPPARRSGDDHVHIRAVNQPVATKDHK
jgi:hypothetical protein